ncbi:MAG: hypothetical protein AB1632_00610 [Nitrospirota bacterium]
MKKSVITVIMILILNSSALADPGFAEGGKKIGQGFKEIALTTGTAFKKTGKAIGKGFKQAGIETGKAFKTMGKEIGRAFSGR